MNAMSRRFLEMKSDKNKATAIGRDSILGNLRREKWENKAKQTHDGMINWRPHGPRRTSFSTSLAPLTMGMTSVWTDGSPVRKKKTKTKPPGMASSSVASCSRPRNGEIKATARGFWCSGTSSPRQLLKGT
jgi:hypothetical protein